MSRLQNEFEERLDANPVIAAVFDTADLKTALDSPCESVFLLCGTICELDSLIKQAHLKDKKMYIHLDLLGGIGKDQSSILYIKNTFQPDGIITTKSNIAKYASDSGLFVIQRLFMLDSKSFEVARRTMQQSDVHAAEILPGVIPGIIKQISAFSKTPVIAGGLIRSKKEAIDVLSAGAKGVSTSCKELWYL